MRRSVLRQKVRPGMSLSQIQTQLAAHLRNPEQVAGPEGVEDRRLKIYRELFYNNIETFISSGFPVLRSLVDDVFWHAMVRDFMIRHRCHSPYFLEITQEFLLYLQHTREAQEDDPPFMLELAHYEWVELGLDVAEDDITQVPHDPDGDLLEGLPVVSPLAWSLAYQFPVHRIGPDFQPEHPEAVPSYLVVYRGRDDRVGFMEANAVTARLLELLQGAQIENGRQALQVLAEEMQHPQPEQLVVMGLDLMEHLRSQSILLGTTV